MKTPNIPHLEVFSPLGPQDLFCNLPDALVEHVTGMTSGLYAGIEAKALPGQSAGLRFETAALLGALPFQDARYSTGQEGDTAELTTSIKNRFADEEEWGLLSSLLPPQTGLGEPILQVNTHVTVTTEPRRGLELGKVISALEPADSPYLETPHPIISRQPSLLNVPGQLIRSRYLKRRQGYQYDPEEQGQIKEKIGAIMREDPTARVDAQVRVSTPGLNILISSSRPALELRSRPTINPGTGEELPPTSPDLVRPSLLVVSALVRYALEENNTTVSSSS